MYKSTKSSYKSSFCVEIVLAKTSYFVSVSGQNLPAEISVAKMSVHKPAFVDFPTMFPMVPFPEQIQIQIPQSHLLLSNENALTIDQAKICSFA